MALTSAQALAFRNAVKADGDSAVATAYATKNSQAIADLYNATASPTVELWRQNVTIAELATAIVGSEAITRTAQQSAAFQMLMSLAPGVIDATSANIRGVFSSVWSATTTLTNMTALAQRNATKFEAIASFITVAAPANVSSVFGYVLSASDVKDALWDGSGTAL